MQTTTTALDELIGKFREFGSGLLRKGAVALTGGDDVRAEIMTTTSAELIAILPALHRSAKAPPSGDRQTRRGRPRKSQETIIQPAAEAGEIPKQVRILAERFPGGAPWPELRAALGYKETAPSSSFTRRYVNTGLVTLENGVYRVATTLPPQELAATG